MDTVNRMKDTMSSARHYGVLLMRYFAPLGKVVKPEWDDDEPHLLYPKQIEEALTSCVSQQDVYMVMLEQIMLSMSTLIRMLYHQIPPEHTESEFGPVQPLNVHAMFTSLKTALANESSPRHCRQHSHQQ